MAGAGTEIGERMEMIAGPRDSDPQLAIAQVERDDEAIGDRVTWPDRAEGISSKLGHGISPCLHDADPVALSAARSAATLPPNPEPMISTS
jgi:hypothetical protein